MGALVLAWDVLAIALAALVAIRWTLLLAGLVGDLVGRARQGPLPPPTPCRVTVLVPAYNEERVLAGTLRSALASRWPDLEILVVDDGSRDATLQVAREQAARDDRVRVLAQPENGGKARALNAGLAAATGEVVITVDADTVLDPCAVAHLVGALQADPLAGAVAANIKVGNRDRWLTRWQSLEYVTALHVDRRAQAFYGCITTVPGAAGAFRREALQAVGGFSGRTVTEDTDLTLSLLRSGRTVRYEPRAVAFTEAPETARGLLAQRTRWLFGYLQCLVQHRGAFFRHGAVGWLGMPNLLYTHLLVYLLLPFFVAYLARLFALLDPVAIGWGLLAWVIFDVGLAAMAYRIDREDWRDLPHAPLWRLAWPLFLSVVFLRVCWRALAHGKVPWGRPDRVGHLADATREGAAPGVVR